MMQPAELSSLKSLINIAKWVALIFLVIWLLVFIGSVVVVGILLAGVGGAGVGVAGALFVGFFYIIFLLIDFLIWYEIRQIQRMVDAGQYEAAKSKSLIWAILGIILGGLIPGIVLLIAYLKFDPVINWQRQSMGGGQAGWMAPAAAPPMGQPMAQPMASPTPAAAPMPPAAAPTCPKCGKPATWIPAYNRWYCYTDQQYI